MARTPSRGRSRINLYAEAVRIFGTDDLFPWGNDAMNDDKERSEKAQPITFVRALRKAGETYASMARAQAADDTDEFPEIAAEANANVDTVTDALVDVLVDDITRTAITLRVFARILVDAHAAATARGASLREAQRRAGHAIDTRADYAEGSAAAYSFALSALEGATGAARAILVGEGWQPASGMAPPTLPEGVAERCPVCGDTERLTLPANWRNRTDDAIPIVGCGNPWHYHLDRAPEPDAYMAMEP